MPDQPYDKVPGRRPGAAKAGAKAPKPVHTANIPDGVIVEPEMRECADGVFFALADAHKQRRDIITLTSVNVPLPSCVC